MKTGEIWKLKVEVWEKDAEENSEVEMCTTPYDYDIKLTKWLKGDWWQVLDINHHNNVISWEDNGRMIKAIKIYEEYYRAPE